MQKEQLKKPCPLCQGKLTALNYMNNYYTKQLEKLSLAPGQSLALQIRDSKGQTNWLDLNNESAQAIIDFLSNNFLDN